MNLPMSIALLTGTCVSLEPGVSVFAEGSGKGSGIVNAFFTSELGFPVTH
jgi:hypothetical protein